MAERKTKNELMVEIDELKKELARLKKYEQYAESAEDTKAIYDSFVDAGFTEDQAFTLLCIFVKSAVSPRR